MISNRFLAFWLPIILCIALLVFLAFHQLRGRAPERPRPRPSPSGVEEPPDRTGAGKDRSQVSPGSRSGVNARPRMSASSRPWGAG